MFTALMPVPTESSLPTAVGATVASSRWQNGFTLGVVYNNKANGQELLSAIADLLCEHYQVNDVVGPIRTAGAYHPSPEQYDDVASRCDVVLVGLGDCGSCSACSVGVAIDFEKRGVTGIAICTKPFQPVGEAIAKRNGFANYEFVMVEHPLSSLTMDGIRARALEALPQVVSILGLDEAGVNPKELIHVVA